MPDARITRADIGAEYHIRVNGPDATFLLRSDRIRQSALAEIAAVTEDLLDIAATVFAADSHDDRGGASGSEMGRHWCREFSFTIPVRTPSLWSRPDVLSALTDLVAFMTGDAPSFEFVSADADQPIQPFLNLDPAGAAFDAEDVILFSGGLDSFAGALETLAAGNGKVVLVSHRSAQKVLPRQARLAKYLMDRIPGRCLHIGVEAHLKSVAGRETTQRSRTLLFAALAHAVAQCFGAKRISFFENGIVSHNLPITPQVVGTLATRTTHPLVLRKLNDVIRLVLPKAPRISNGYAWLTKQQVVERIARFEATEHIKSAVSCAIVREQTNLHTHCGCCSQCLDRRFAILAAGLAEHDPVESYKTDVLQDAIPEGRSRTMAVEWTRHAVKLSRIEMDQFLQSFGPEFVRIQEGHPDLNRQTIARQTLAMHRRHGAAVAAVLERELHARAHDLVVHDLAPTSLLMLHLGNREAVRDVDLPPMGSIVTLPTEIEEVDIIDDPATGLTAAFFEENGAPIVAVRGLCRVKGAPAKVAHSLKPAFDEDRANGLRAEDHRFVLVHLCNDYGLTKAAARKYVGRCRKYLAEAYRDVHGHPPSKPLLVESCSPRGYRLAPATRLVTPDQLG